MPIHFRSAGDRIILFGQTFPHKDAIKALGGRFNGADKTWWLPYTPALFAQIKTLCIATGGGALGAPVASGETVSGQTSPLDHGDDGIPPWAPEAGKRTLESPKPSLVKSLAPQAVDGLPAATQRPDKESAGLSVSALMEAASRAMTHAFPAAVWVIGEVQNLAVRGHSVFLQLADAKEGHGEAATVTVKATIWSDALRTLHGRHGEDKVREILQDGMKVRCLCRVTLYKDRGQISLAIEDIDPTYTKGALALAREKLLRELRAKGLDQLNKRVPLARFPFDVGLISADGSRAETDFLHQLFNGGFPGRVIYQPCPMQGDSVTSAVVKALERLATKGCDVIVMTRGGGSLADLRWFDAPEIAYAIASCPVPVIAAIGHHEDVCVAEEIAFQREKTPTAAAQFLLSWFADTRERMMECATDLVSHLSRRLEHVSHVQNTLTQRLAAVAFTAFAARSAALMQLEFRLKGDSLGAIHIHLTQLQGLASTLHLKAMAHLAAGSEALNAVKASLTQADPRPWMIKGWTQLVQAGRILKSVSDVAEGTSLRARLPDGRLTLEVKIIEPAKVSADHKENHP